MKISYLIAAISLLGSALASKKKTHKGWRIPGENEPLPLHELPDCYQQCFQEKNSAPKPFDINKVTRKEYCDDGMANFGRWWTWHVQWCAKRECVNEAEWKYGMSWTYKLCGRPTEKQYSGKDSWKDAE
ncbi:hypothetical protein EsH8_I_000222 [Colletotrichum jinshuiense]